MRSNHLSYLAIMRGKINIIAISPAFAGANIIHTFNISIWFFIYVIFSILHEIKIFTVKKRIDEIKL